ncbi:MAG: methyltransferase domain-containing protein [Steroidobacteraceae bacterium]|jgi:SAM-dependent methyltransferase|nr:methyltransferase domain-containing protein [Steroidobacteraceae bacterium]
MSTSSPTAAGPPLALLRCPQCLGDAALDPAADGWRCTRCDTAYPRLGGLAWLLPAPEARRVEWRQRFRLLERELEAARAAIGERLDAGGLLAATRARLERLRAAQAAQVEELRELLAPLEPEASIARLETLLALRTRTPLTQDLNSYYVNVHRDWAWGERENAAALQLATDLLAGAPARRVLVPGCGAGRLAFDLHHALRPELTLGLDLNPMLAWIAARVAGGGEVALHEFPVAPRCGSDVAVARRLRAPHAASAGLEFAIGDALRAPLRPGSFDAVLTPWFVDIVPHAFAPLVAQVAAMLRAGGTWANFGSLSFNQRDPASWHGPDEIVAILEGAGFEVLQTLDRQLPYLQSPASRHGRIETVFGFAARLRRTAAEPPPLDNLPDWLGDAARPVPLLPHFQTQALANRVVAYTFALIDGRRSTEQIAAHLVGQKLLLPGEAEAAVRSFLVALYEESQRRARF